MTISGDLKSLGNAFFGAKDYVEAEKHYTRAIEASGNEDGPKGPGLAVLYANRAACLLCLKRYMDAERDATKATKLDPTYAKGFARLATAQDCLGNYTTSSQNWRRALDALPEANLGAAEQNQKTQYEAGLMTTNATLVKLGLGGGSGLRHEARSPWDRAAVIIARLRIQRSRNSPPIFSSAWVIHFAHEEFMNGVGLASQLQINPATGYPAGALLGIASLTNAVLRDRRVIHCPTDELIAKCNEQLRFEARVTGAWDHDRPELVIQSALVRQSEQGWPAARQALSITVRGWILHAVVEASVNQRHDIAAMLYKNCLDVLSSLRATWIEATPKDRGVVFENSFIFGLRRIYLDALMKSEPTPDLLEVLQQQSDALILELEEALPRSPAPREESADPGFFSSFYMYPRGQAFAAKGFYYKKIATRTRSDPNFCFRRSALEYLKSVQFFPEDDEQHPWLLNEALESMLNARSFPLPEILDVLNRIGVSALKAKEIWECSSLGAGVWATFHHVAQQEARLRLLVEEGKLSMEACVGSEVLRL
ncbi:hypothetical protein C8F04DRAFT_1130487 [Mycena alexandri]|uniref:TPR-like protein n=1 Tax=Mycena alexandri TaxID=1745969 RepID=A0AAD6WXF5_9AGAR|nr:hypothetical protein C8F04DRAFT_1130487 [Mycena alexandri]